MELEPEERAELEGIVARGKHNARTVKRAQILLATGHSVCRQDRPAVTDEQLAAVLGVGTSTVFRVCRRWVEHGYDEALQDRPGRGAPPRFVVKDTAVLVGLACTEPPPGSVRWTLGLAAASIPRHEPLGASREGERTRPGASCGWRQRLERGQR